jgi:NADPH:quinone reductase
MRALTFVHPADDTSATAVLDLPSPQPGPGQVSIDVAYAIVSFKDVMARRGDPGYVRQWPYVPGLGVAGTVRALGRGVTDLVVGQRVTAVTNAGGLAEVALTEAALTAPVPDGLSLELAAAAPDPLTTASLLVDDAARVREGDVVLIHTAAGAVGRAIAPFARAAGARLVLGTVGDRRRVAAALTAGYDGVAVRGPHLADEIRAKAGGGVDVVLDPQGTQLLDLDLEVVAPGGRIVLFGNATGQPFGDLPPVSRLTTGNLSIGGMSLAWLSTTAPHRVAAALGRVLDRLHSQAVTVDITPVGGLDEAAEAQQRLAEGRGEGKYVVRVGAAP